MVILVILMVIVLVWSPEHVVGWSSRSILVFPVSHPNDHVMEEGCWTLDLPRPYSLAITVQLLRRTPNNLVNRWEADRYIRGIRTPQGNCLVTVRQCGSIEASAAEVTIAARDLSESVHAAVIAILRRVLALDVELAELSARFDGEPGLQSIAQHLRGMRPPRFPDLFETIASVVPFQQLSLESGAALLNRLVQAFGESVEHDGLQAWVFPSARSVAAATVADVRGCGFSTAKAQTLTHVARLIRSGALTESHLAVLPTAGLMTALENLPGIGRWTSAVIALRGFGRLDAFPPDDAGIRRYLGQVFGRVEPLSHDEERGLVERLGPARGLLYFYVLGWRLAQRGLIGEIMP
jgi:DNA-3-methyladenine glycosylase II